LRPAIDAEGDHSNSLRTFSRYSWRPLSNFGEG
jgi:hypothetical protein